MSLKIEQIEIHDLIPAEHNPRELTPALRALLRASLEEFGWINPVIVNRVTGRILTGHQRTIVASEDLGWSHCPVTYVSVPEDKEAMAVIRLNDISGRWNFRNRTEMQNQHYAQMSRKSLGSGYKGWVLGDEPYNQSNKDHKRIVRELLGDLVVDYGCGKMTEFPLLQKLGIQTIGYDPYQKPPKVNQTDKFRPRIEHTRALAQKFLADLRSIEPREFTVVNQAVLSSIGYADVREDVAAILGALAYIGQRGLLCAMLSTSSEPYENFLYGRVKNTTGKAKGGRTAPAAAPARQLYVPDESEPNLFVTNPGTSRQIYQKYFTPDDVTALFEPFFTDFEIKSLRMVHVVRAYNDEPPDTDFLRGAIYRQFDALEIDDEPLGLGAEAWETFLDLIDRRGDREYCLADTNGAQAKSAA